MENNQFMNATKITHNPEHAPVFLFFGSNDGYSRKLNSVETKLCYKLPKNEKNKNE